MKTVIYVTAEAATAMKPWAGANEDSCTKPFWTVVAGGSTVIGSDVIVAIGTFGSYSDFDADLSLCGRSDSREAEYGDGGYQQMKC
jgi:hypothetical protein